MLAVGNLQHPIKSLNGSGYIQDATIKKWLDIPYMTYQEKFAISINRSTNDHIQDAPIKKLWNIPHDLFRNITEDMFYRFITKGSNSYTHLTLENIWYGQKKKFFFFIISQAPLHQVKWRRIGSFHWHTEKGNNPTLSL